MVSQDMIVTVFVVVLLAAILLPVAFTQIFTANTTAWDANTVTIFSLIPIITIVGVILGLVSFYKIRGS